MKIKTFILTLLFIQIFGLLFFLPQTVRAEEGKCPPEGNLRVRVYVPNISKDIEKKEMTDENNNKYNCYYVADIPHYIRAIYEFGIMSGGIVATVVLIISGFMWLSAGGHAPQITKAKDLLSGALVGYIMLLLAYFILSLINPSLVNLRMPEIGGLGNADGCCIFYDPVKKLKSDAQCKIGIKKNDCENNSDYYFPRHKVGTECYKKEVAIDYFGLAKSEVWDCK